MPKETSDKELEEVENMVVPLVVAMAGIIDNKLLLIDEYQKVDDALTGPPVSP